MCCALADLVGVVYALQKQKGCFSLTWLQVQYQTMCIQTDQLHCLIAIGPPILDMQTGKQLKADSNRNSKEITEC